MNIIQEIEKENFSDKFKNELVEIITQLNPKNLSEYRKILVEFKQSKGIIPVGRFTKLYWISRGWSEKEAKNKKIKFKRKLDFSPMQVKFWLDKINPKTNINFTEEEAKYKISTQRKSNINYWIEQGHTLEEAKKQVEIYQKENANKFSIKNKQDPTLYKDRTISQLLYWVNKHGMSIEEAKIKLNEIQSTLNLEKIMKKHGTFEGQQRYDQICKNMGFSKTLAGYIEKYGEIEGSIKYQEKNEKCCRNFYYVSKESLMFFQPIYKELLTYLDPTDIYFGINEELMNTFTPDNLYYGIQEKNEYFLWDNVHHKIFFYDFTIPKYKIIIEYHGIRYHPNPNWDKSTWDKWKFMNMDADTKRQLDQYKNSVATRNGFEVFEVWADEKNLFDKDLIINKIKQNLAKN